MRNLILSIAFILGMNAFAQDIKNVTLETIPAEVSLAFQNQFPNSTAEWRSNYQGNDDEQLVFIGTFKINSIQNAVIYDKEGIFQALETSITTSQLPISIQKYMSANYPKNPIRSVSKTINNKTKVIYEVGIIRGTLFYDLVFNGDGDFLQMVEKD